MICDVFNWFTICLKIGLDFNSYETVEQEFYIWLVRRNSKLYYPHMGTILASNVQHCHQTYCLFFFLFKYINKTLSLGLNLFGFGPVRVQCKHRVYNSSKKEIAPTLPSSKQWPKLYVLQNLYTPCCCHNIIKPHYYQYATDHHNSLLLQHQLCLFGSTSFETR